MDALQAISGIGAQEAITSRALTGKSAGDMNAAAKEFEAMFMAQMVKPMFDTVEVNGNFGGGHGEEMMRGFLVQEYGKSLAEGSKSGLSDAIKQDMIRLQEAAQSGGAA